MERWWRRWLALRRTDQGHIVDLATPPSLPAVRVTVGDLCFINPVIHLYPSPCVRSEWVSEWVCLCVCVCWSAAALFVCTLRGWWKDAVNEGDGIMMRKQSEQEKVKFLQSAPRYSPTLTSSPPSYSLLPNWGRGLQAEQADRPLISEMMVTNLSFLLSLPLSASLCCSACSLSLYSHTTSSSDTHLITV